MNPFLFTFIFQMETNGTLIDISGNRTFVPNECVYTESSFDSYTKHFEIMVCILEIVLLHTSSPSIIYITISDMQYM